MANTIIGETLVTTLEAAKPDSKTPIPTRVAKGTRFAHWGSRNALPSAVMAKMYKNPMALPAINRKVGMTYGAGLRYYKKGVDSVTGQHTKQYVFNEEIERFIEENSLLTRWVIPQLVEYRIFANTFSELIFNREKTKVVRLNHLTDEFTRLTPQSPKTLRNEYLAYSAHFLTTQEPADEYVILIPLLDIENVASSLAKISGYKVGIHNFYHSPGRVDYARAPWEGIFRDGGWMDVSNDIPEIIAALHRNQMVIKYHIKVPASYWTFWYKDWDTYTDEQKIQMQKDQQEKWNNFLTGNENAGKTFVSTYGVDPYTNNPIPGFEIIALEDKVKKDEYIPNSEEASKMIHLAFGIDTSLTGLSTSKNTKGAGSGSDMREANNQSTMLTTIDEHIVFQPLNIISKINKWGVTFEFQKQFTTTLNQDPSGLIGVENP